MITAVAQKINETTFSDPIPIGCLAENVKMVDGENAENKINGKIDKTDIVINLTTEDNTKVLSAKQGKILNDKIVNNTYSLIGGNSIHANDDLNDYITVGNYCCQNTIAVGTLLNCPVSYAFIMQVFLPTGSNEYIGQQVKEFYTGKEFYRYMVSSSSTWGEWILLGGSASSEVWSLDIGNEIPADSDLNNYTDIGNYCCSSLDNSKTLLNSPVQITFDMKVFHPLGSKTNIAQQIQIHCYGDDANGSIYFRNKLGDTNWSDWKILTSQPLQWIKIE